MTQPKRRLTSSTQRGGRSSGSAWRSRSMAPLPEPAGPAWLPAQLPPGGPEPGMLGPAATAAGRTSCPPSGHPAPGVAALPPGSPGSATQRAGLRPGPGRAESLVLGKVTPGQCSLYLAPAPPLPRAWGCSCLRPCSLQLWFRFQVLLGEGRNGIHLLKACVSSLDQVASCPRTLSHWLRIGLQIRSKSAWSAATTPSRSLAHAGPQGLGRQPWPWVRRLAHYPQLHCLPQLALLPAPSTSQDCQGAHRRRADFRNTGLGLRQNHAMRRTCIMRADGRSPAL